MGRQLALFEPPSVGRDDPPTAREMRAFGGAVWLHETHALVDDRFARTCRACGAAAGERCAPDVAYRVPAGFGGAGVWYAFHGERRRQG